MIYDLVIKNGKVIDGTGKKYYNASIGISGDIIQTISDSEIEGKTVINADGLIVAPGFIDVHTHTETGFLKDTLMYSKLSQGVTTDIIGNCGISMFPKPKDKGKLKDFNNYCGELLLGIDDVESDFYDVGEYNNYLIDKKISMNCGILVGHGTIRINALGFADRKASKDEIEIMKNLLENEMQKGALGMSLGLIYPPGSYSDKEELTELAKIIKKYNGVLSSHMRNEGDRIFESVEEMIEVAEKSGSHVHISHLKLMGPKNWKRASELVALIKSARSRGVNITADQYPYQATSTTLAAITPGYLKDGGNTKMVERLLRPNETLLKEIGLLMNSRGGAKCVSIAYTHGNMTEIEGKNIFEISKILNKSEEETVAHILGTCDGKVTAVYHSMSEEDVDYIMSQEDILIASDGFSFEFNEKDRGGVPHPRTFGTFPRFLRLNREKKLLPIEKAIRKITSLPAEYFNLDKNGYIREGYLANITIFDEEEITDKSTFSNPFQESEGINYVIINGKIVIDNKELKNIWNGKVFLKK